MLLNSRALAALALTTTVFLQACASGGMVKENDRDTSGKFDGAYVMDVKKMAGLQYVQNWNMSCGGDAYSTALFVKDGKATVKPFSPRGKQFTTYVSDSGHFRLEIPLKSKAKASGASSITMADGRRKVIIKGNLNRGSGDFIVGIKEFGWQGCRTGVSYRRT